MECSNELCSYNYDGYCQNNEDEYLECEEQFYTADSEDDEDYAFVDYDCEYGLFGDEQEIKIWRVIEKQLVKVIYVKETVLKDEKEHFVVTAKLAINMTQLKVDVPLERI